MAASLRVIRIKDLICRLIILNLHRRFTRKSFGSSRVLGHSILVNIDHFFLTCIYIYILYIYYIYYIYIYIMICSHKKVLLHGWIWRENPTFDELGLVDVLESLNFLLPGEAQSISYRIIGVYNFLIWLEISLPTWHPMCGSTIFPSRPPERGHGRPPALPSPGWRTGHYGISTGFVFPHLSGEGW